MLFSSEYILIVLKGNTHMETFYKYIKISEIKQTYLVFCSWINILAHIIDLNGRNSKFYRLLFFYV